MCAVISNGYPVGDGSRVSRVAVAKNSGTAALDRNFKIKHGQELAIKGQKLKVKFESLVEDSRCPSDVECVWAGDAKIVIRVRRGNAMASNIELHTNGQFSQAGKYQQYVIKLVALDPYPKSSTRAKPGDYVATLVITKE